MVKKEKKAKTAKRAKKPASPRGLNVKYLGGFLLKKMARGGATQLRSNADEVNKLNVFPVPDGDTGDNMRMTIESGLTAIENIDTDNLAEVMKALSHGMLIGARGNSGVILSQFFAGTAKGLEKSKKADPETLGHALEKGVEQAYSSVMTPTEGTILTVAREAVEYAVSRITPESTIRTFFADLVREMHASVDRTPEILTVLKDAGVVDSGGAGLFYIMDGFNRVLNGEELQVKEEATSDSASAPSVALTTSFNADSEMTYGYCTELLLQLQNKKTDPAAFDVEPLKAFLSEIGDSVVCFKTDSIVKLHVHTFAPERVLEHCRKYGEFLTVKIENMSVQHSSSDAAEEAGKPAEGAEATAEGDETVTEESVVLPQNTEATASADAPRRRFGAVAVCNGAGIEGLYADLGTDVIIRGGQTHNPSTGDFLQAFEQINAEHIFVFPNNSNIFMAAQQAAELYTASAVHVIPSKSIGTGYVALSSADFENAGAEENERTMLEAMERVTTGYVSPSIRDADLNGVHINKGDTIGIINKEIVVSENDRLTAAQSLASMLLDMPEKFMLTVFGGEDAQAGETEALDAFLREKYPAAEVYFMEGGQEIYPYIFVAE